MAKDAVEVADVVEMLVWASRQPITVSTLQEDLHSAWETEDDSEGPEALAISTFEILFERSKLLRSSYPFDCDGNRLELISEPIAGSSYLFCLGIKFFSSDLNLSLRTREFEGIVQKAAESYFRGKSVRIGAPWATGEVTDYRQLLQLVADLIPDLGRPTRGQAPGGGDAGWDIVLVNNFEDRRFSRIIALGNCATGVTDWAKKGAEKSTSLFWDFFERDPLMRNTCLTFSAIPFLMTDEDKLAKAYHNNIIFDRIRICEHSPVASATVMEWLEDHREAACDIALL